ncbi:hypothetical protein [Lignipirellula cremea]|uniref:Uncharacterized protein n=1 Tax=Lignipirellula cremea TaxID=2528010 RepID=A0A518E408_9BACT|nr:hypothetical protein [Lignipirellula cremea]QDU98811.1 hypothetical protein Pla8534_67220 [Lignipirellula cremea]
MAICTKQDRVVVKTPVGWAYFPASVAGFDGVYQALREGMPREVRLAWHEMPGVKLRMFRLFGVPLSIALTVIATVLLVVVFERLNLSFKPIEHLLTIMMLLPVFGGAFVAARVWWRKRRARSDK